MGSYLVLSYSFTWLKAVSQAFLNARGVNQRQPACTLTESQGPTFVGRCYPPNPNAGAATQLIPSETHQVPGPALKGLAVTRMLVYRQVPISFLVGGGGEVFIYSKRLGVGQNHRLKTKPERERCKGIILGWKGEAERASRRNNGY